MILAGLIGSGWQVILILTLILIFLAVRKLPEIFHGVEEGIREFKKATREATEELQGESHETGETPHPMLVVLTILLGAMSFILVIYEIQE